MFKKNKKGFRGIIRGNMEQEKSRMHELEKMLEALGFKSDDVHLAYTSSHEGLPARAWYHPRPGEPEESLALVSYYDDGKIILRDYLQNGMKKETVWTIDDLDPDWLEKIFHGCAMEKA